MQRTTLESRIHVAAKHDGRCFDPSLRRLDEWLGTTTEGPDRRLFEYLDAEPRRRLRLTNAKIERMKMPAPPVDQSAVIDRRTDHGCDLIRFHKFEMVAIAGSATLVDVSPQPVHVARPRCDFTPAMLQVTRDLITTDPILNDVVSKIADVGQHTPACFAELAFDAVLPADPADHLSAIAP
jgi:hypothetical protein